MKTILKEAKLIMVRTDKFRIIYLRYKAIKYLIVQISTEFWEQCLTDKTSFDFIKHQTIWKAKRISGAWMPVKYRESHTQQTPMPRIDLKRMHDINFTGIVHKIPFHGFEPAYRNYTDGRNVGRVNFVFKVRVFADPYKSYLTMLRTLNFMNA